MPQRDARKRKVVDVLDRSHGGAVDGHVGERRVCEPLLPVPVHREDRRVPAQPVAAENGSETRTHGPNTE